MGRRARAAGVANAALRAMQAQRRAADETAQRVASEVYATCVEIRGDLVEEPGSTLRNYPMWMLGPLQYVAQGAAVVIAKTHRLPEDRLVLVAAYLFSLLIADMEGMVADFDVEHFEKWTPGAAPAAG